MVADGKGHAAGTALGRGEAGRDGAPHAQAATEGPCDTAVLAAGVGDSSSFASSPSGLAAQPGHTRGDVFRATDALIEALREGGSLADLAERLAGGSLSRLADVFDSCCDQRMLRNLLRLEQYERAFRLERLKRDAMDRLFEMSQGQLIPETGSPESIREIDFQRRAIVSFLRTNAFPSARDIREDQQINSSGTGTPPMADWTPKSVVNEWARELRRGSDVRTARQAARREVTDPRPVQTAVPVDPGVQDATPRPIRGAAKTNGMTPVHSGLAIPASKPGLEARAMPRTSLPTSGAKSCPAPPPITSERARLNPHHHLSVADTARRAQMASSANSTNHAHGETAAELMKPPTVTTAPQQPALRVQLSGRKGGRGQFLRSTNHGTKGVMPVLGPPTVLGLDHPP